MSVFIVALFLLRPWWLWQLWCAPLKRGAGQFLGIEVEAEFYRHAGAALLRRFRLWTLVPLGLEMVLLLALMLSGRWVYALYEQLPAVVLLTLWFNFTAVQFMTRVRLLTSDAPAPAATGVQLSLAPRRLRDYSAWRVEAVLGGLTLLALLWLLAQWLDFFPPPPSAEVFRTVVFLFYLQKEYPPTPVAEGRFLAGGLLYLNRDNPVILARSPQGLAINLAHRGTYILVAYLTGLILLVLWQVGH